MFLSWELCRRDGRAFRDLQDRDPGSHVEIRRNAERTASIAVPARELADARTGAARVHAGTARLRVYARAAGAPEDERPLIFNGLLTSPRATHNPERVELPARDQSLRLERASTAPLKPPGEGQIVQEGNGGGGIDASEFYMRVIELADERVEAMRDGDYPDAARIGIEAGDLAVTGINRVYTLPDTKRAWEWIAEEAERNRAPDFELEPIEEPPEGSDIHARLNTFFPRQGADLSDGPNAVELIDGLNARVAHEPSITDPLFCNVFAAIGKASELTGSISPVWVARNLASIDTYGEWYDEAAYSEINDMDRLRRKAEAEVAARSRPANHFEVTLPLLAGGQATGWARDAEGAPLLDPSDTWQIPPNFLPPPYGAFWIGDEVAVRSERFYMGVQATGSVRSSFKARVEAARFVEVDRAGNCGIELELVTDEQAAAISGYESEVFQGIRA